MGGLAERRRVGLQLDCLPACMQLLPVALSGQLAAPGVLPELNFLRWPCRKQPKMVIRLSSDGVSTAKVANRRCRRGSMLNEPAVGFMHATSLWGAEGKVHK